MENTHSTVTSDGRIGQEDNPYFQGRELMKVSPAEVDEALGYLKKQFSVWEKYAETSLKIIRSQKELPERLEKIEQLKNEIVSAKAVGDFTALLGKIDAVKEELAKTSSDEPADDKQQVMPDDNKEPETGTGQEGETKQPEAKQPEAEQPEAKQPEVDYPETLKELVELTHKAKELSKKSDWQFVQHELDDIQFKWDELVKADESLVSASGYDQLLKDREAARKYFFERKAAWQEKRREKKKTNLEKRAGLLDQLQNIIDHKKWQAFKQVGVIAGKWEEIRDLPNDDEVRQQENKYQELLKVFNEKKVEFLVKKAEKEEENLVGKLAILDKMKQIVSEAGPDTENWEKRDAEMEELSRQWRKIGHVPLEQSDKIWEQFKSIRDDFFNKKFEHNPAFRDQTLKNIRKKTKMCEQAEALLEKEDMAEAVREINNLHKKWKKTGPVPKEKNDELWERFNAATQKFNEKKSNNLDTIREQEQQNLKEKVLLCEKAEAYANNTDWAETSKQMDALMQQWKEIGPVPRRKSGKIWRRFKKAMDKFYENRRQHYRQIREEQKVNYEKKKEILSELGKLTEHENPQDAVKLAKNLQEEFKKIGFVPIKKKNKVEKEYKEVCDKIYQRVRGAGRASGSTESRTASGSGDRALRDEYFKLKKECDKLHDEIVRYRDSMTFINPGGKGNALIDEVQQKIDNAEKKLEEKQEKLEELRRKIED